MSQRKLIYTKRFSKSEFDENELKDDDIVCTFKKLPPTAEELLKDYEENTKYVLNEERDKKKELFLSVIKDVCEFYQLDVDIYEKSIGYDVNLYLYMGMYGGALKNLIVKALAMADNFDIFKADENEKNYDVLLSLTYNTHDRYYKGELRNWF